MSIESKLVPGLLYSVADLRWRRLDLTPAPRNTERAWEVIYTGSYNYDRAPSYVRLYFVTGYGWVVDHVNARGNPFYYDDIRVWSESSYGWALLRASRVLDRYRRSYSIRDVPINLAAPRLTLTP